MRRFLSTVSIAVVLSFIIASAFNTALAASHQREVRANLNDYNSETALERNNEPEDIASLINERVADDSSECDLERFLDCAKEVAAAESTWQSTPVNCRSSLQTILEPRTFKPYKLTTVCRAYMETNLCAEQTHCIVDEVFRNIKNNSSFPPDLRLCYETSREVCTDVELTPSQFHSCTGCIQNNIDDCFADDSTVLTNDGRQLKVAQLSVGDSVLTVDTYTGAAYFDEVITFLHREESNNKPKKFVQLTLANNVETRLSPNHLIYAASTEELSIAIQNNQTFFGQAKFAIDVMPGDHVFMISESGSLNRSSEVLAVNLKVVPSGLHAPLTASGNIVVDGVLMSCYASVGSHNVGHWSMAPLRAYYKISTYLSYFLPLSFNWLSTHTDDGVHRYADMLRHITGGTFCPKVNIP